MPIDHKTIEAKWQARWRDAGLHRTTFDPNRPKFYALDMFPYPSGAGLHVGHCEGYTATDIITRWKRMQGLERAAPHGLGRVRAAGRELRHQARHPPARDDGTGDRQFPPADRLGRLRLRLGPRGQHHRSRVREVDAVDLLETVQAGVWRTREPSRSTGARRARPGLANEEVSQGRCERCGTMVERKDMRQWLLRITRYADRLLEDLALVDWPESTLAMQRNWIGRSEGAEVLFKSARPVAGREIRVFTTRPDTLYGATYMVLSPEHPLVDELTTPAQRPAVAAYQQQARHKSDLERTDLTKDKTGVFTGATAVNPVNGRRDPDLDRRLRARDLRHGRDHGGARRTTSATMRSRASSESRSCGWSRRLVRHPPAPTPTLTMMPTRRTPPLPAKAWP